MKAGYMTTAQFIEKYCPDYEEKNRKLNVLKSKANTSKYSKERGEICRRKENLSESMFAEALENFRKKAFMGGYNAQTDEIAELCRDTWNEACEAMREKCLSLCWAGWEPSCDNCYDSNLDRMKKAPIPEPPKKK